jgi:hypothetical protein
MRLSGKPAAPRDGSFFVPYQHLRSHNEWGKFLVA